MQDNIGIFVLGISVVVILTVAVRQNLFRDVNDMITTLKIGRHNVEYQLAPDRRKPIVLTDKEMGLKQLHPSFFGSFNREDWQEFWDIIYGVHPLIKFSNEKLAGAGRNYSIAEIQEVLVRRYPEGFSGFNAEQWKIFWKEIFGIIDYKIQIPSQDEWVEKQRDKSDRRLDKKIKQDDEKISATIQGAKKEIGVE
ncbi:MAG: hypothetical protein PHS93_01480 [Candidatus Omnitrophica bacterium]|nr:hypothetical protein [Candidatus Omnitrophota bacterium]MDD5351822.1 hypothetical protein [Candidatus Omnitrophota bacterium]MDD5550648.1 hypothetical protein [Candidatus Omnitrophota bacterium]